MKKSKIRAIKKHGTFYEKYLEELSGVQLTCPECEQTAEGWTKPGLIYPFFSVIEKAYEGTRYLLKCTCCRCEFYITVEDKKEYTKEDYINPGAESF